MQIFSRIKAWSDSRGITAQELPEDIDWKEISYQLSLAHNLMSINGVSGYVLNKLEELEEYAYAMNKGDVNGAVDAIADSSIFDATELCKMGYNVEKTFDEVLKVVESRTGQWDEDLGKFAKDKSPEAQARWYEPDYEKNCQEKVCKTPSLFGFGKEVA